MAALEAAVYGGGRAYVHCTAGLGRAPAVAIAYLYWFDPRGLSLDQAYAHVTSRRPCGPKREAVRAATFDIITGGRSDDFAKVDGEKKKKKKKAWAGVAGAARFLRWLGD